MEYRVKVVVSSKKESVTVLRDGRLEVRVNAPRSEGKANDRAMLLVSEYLNISQDKISIVRGHTQSSKVLSVKA